MTDAETADLYAGMDDMAAWAVRHAESIGLHPHIDEVQAPKPEKQE